MSELIAKLEAVKDERTFTVFLLALAEDRRNNIDEWQWSKIEDFLEASASWAEDSKDGLRYYSLPDNPWKRCADIIYCGKIYE